MIDLRFSRFALGVCAAAAIFAGCGGSQTMTSAPSTGVQPATRAASASTLKGYYLAQFTTVVGNSLPGSSLCLRFKSSGSWSSTSFNGTYLTSGKKLFASGVWLPSPAVFMSFQGSVNAKQGSGTFITSDQNGDIYGGGTFTMTGKQNKTCS
jgi:hypothetical protein